MGGSSFGSDSTLGLLGGFLVVEVDLFGADSAVVFFVDGFGEVVFDAPDA